MFWLFFCLRAEREETRLRPGFSFAPRVYRLRREARKRSRRSGFALSISYLTVSVGTISMKAVLTSGASGPMATPCQGWALNSSRISCQVESCARSSTGADLRHLGDARVRLRPDLRQLPGVAAGLILPAELGGGPGGGEQRGGPVGHAQQRALELRQRLRRPAALEQHLAEQLQRRLQDVRRPGGGRQGRLGVRRFGEEPQSLLLLPARQLDESLDLLLLDRRRVAVGARRRRPEPRQRLLGRGGVAAPPGGQPRREDLRPVARPHGMGRVGR